MQSTKRIANSDPAARLIRGNGILERSATAEAQVGQIPSSRHVGVEISIAYSLDEKAKGRASVNITVRLNNFTPDPKGGEAAFGSDTETFGDWLDVRDLEPFAIALTEAVRLAKLDGTIQPWMVTD